MGEEIKQGEDQKSTAGRLQRAVTLSGRKWTETLLAVE